ncbi:MAG: glycosyltransferase family 4 protein [Actinomycetota bacterium]|nr:glycosyltransferase family 4 protein [Actinomycetota bacterium]
MRVLTVGNLYPPHHFGGYELIWRSSVEHMRDAGHEVRVLASDLRLPSGPARDEPGSFRELRWYWCDGEFPRLGVRERMALERDNRATFYGHIDAFRPDVIGWWPMGGMSLALLEWARRRGVPDAGVVGDDWMLYGPKVDLWLEPLLRRRYRPPAALVGLATGLPTRFEPSFTRWLFISETVRRNALAAGLSLPRSEVAHPGVDPAVFAPLEPREFSWRLTYAGRIDPRKGIATAIEALALLPEQATLTVDGPGDHRHRAQLEERVAELDLSRRVSFSERPREQLRELFGDSDVVLFPVQWEEPWGLVPLEAMAVGTPVAATGAGGSGEYMRHEQNSLVFDRNAGPPALAEAVQRLARDPALRARLRRGGLDTARRYTAHAFNQAVLRCLERAVKEGGGAAAHG